MSDKNYANHEVQSLKALYRDDQKSNGHKFQDELQNIVRENPGQLKAVVKQMEQACEHKGKNGRVDSTLPQLDIYMDHGKVTQIDVKSQDKGGVPNGKDFDRFLINGKNVINDQEAGKHEAKRIGESYFPTADLQDLQKKNQVKIDEEANKGNLVWANIDGKSYPMDPEYRGRLHPAQDAGNSSSVGFQASWINQGRQDAVERYRAWLDKDESVVQQMIDTGEKVWQLKPIQ